MSLTKTKHETTSVNVLSQFHGIHVTAGMEAEHGELCPML